MTFTLINVRERQGRLVTGSWLQHHTGTLKTARAKARETEKANGGKIDVAVVEFTSDSRQVYFEVEEL